MRGRLFCRTFFTSTSDRTRWRIVKEKGLNLEADVLSRAVKLFLDEELVVVDGKVIFKPGINRFLQSGASQQ